MPLLIHLNGSLWSYPYGAFNAYWKTIDGGRYLSRYQDGQVNQSISSAWSPIGPDILGAYLQNWPYQPATAPNALFLTYSEEAIGLQASKRQILELALQFWSDLDKQYPGTIVAITTDAEVSAFSFRDRSDGTSLPIGFEDFNILPYCAHHRISDCHGYFKNHRFLYQTPEDREWFSYRADVHRKFVQATVTTIRSRFPTVPIYTHQIGVPDGEFLSPPKQFDWASPQSTMFVDGAQAGFTSFIHRGEDSTFRTMIEQVSAKAKGQPWGIVEFNPGKEWSGTKPELAIYTRKMLSLIKNKGANLVLFLSWISTPLDTGIRDSGIDQGIKDYLEKGPQLDSSRK